MEGSIKAPFGAGGSIQALEASIHALEASIQAQIDNKEVKAQI